MEPADSPVRYALAGKVATLTLDDGKANALGYRMIEALDAALTRATDEARAVVLVGRPGRFCAGFDLEVMRQGPAAIRDLMRAGARLMMRLYGGPLPAVGACTGHAVAGGALLLLCLDTRVAAAGPFKIGLNEVSIGLPVPILAHRLAADRLDPRALTAATMQATLYGPEEAARVGFVDRVVAPDALLESTAEVAARLAELPAAPYAATRKSLRRASIEHITSTLEADLAALAGLAP